MLAWHIDRGDDLEQLGRPTISLKGRLDLRVRRVAHITAEPWKTKEKGLFHTYALEQRVGRQWIGRRIGPLEPRLRHPGAGGGRQPPES